jgi:alanyl-tRNA synthetase
MITGNEIRQSFLDYFAAKTHTVVRSSSLVPDKDPTLLFTNAGMVQFKKIFLGQERPPYVRAASAQKCLRISGKHNDLEVVGRDTYHHTFFEMLGNWSFGDYYKAEAIEWAWRLLTEEWALPKDKLYATVYLNDDEAETLWFKISGLPADRVSRFGEKENFWEMGETGPCGPCSEIHLDRGPQACDRQGVANHECRVNGDCARYIELWNLVFIQYNRKDDRSLEELPSKHVDTGMGLERITAILQRVPSNYDTDLFQTIISRIEAVITTVGNLNGYGKSQESDVSYRAIADHARAMSFLIADGLRPGNGQREYVLRRLIRRAARHARNLGVGMIDHLLASACTGVVQAMGDAYTELVTEQSTIQQVVQEEVTRFETTLVMGEPFLASAIHSVRNEGRLILPGEVAFRLHDTYGYPLDMTEDILRDHGMTVDREAFDRLMEEQRTRGREARVSQVLAPVSLSASGTVASPCRFTGYDRLDDESTVLAIYADGSGKPEAVEGDEVDLLTAETPFYGESGGQVGDRGTITTARGDVFEVIDTQHPTPQLTAHRGKMKKGRVQVGDKVLLQVDRKYRQKTKLNHSATHILHAVLRRELGQHVRQAGSLVSPERLRFDFNHTGAIPPGKLAAIETEVNQHIREDADVSIQELSYEEAIRQGALAFFGDKYGDRVRVVKMGGFSTELCGGTHVHASGEIGIFKLHSEGGVAAGVRRVEALTGEGALDLIHNYEQRLKEIGNLVRGSTDDAVEKVQKLLDRQKELEREIEKVRGELEKDQISDLMKKKLSVNGANVVISQIEGVDDKQLSAIADQLKQRLGSGFVFLANTSSDKVTLVGSTTSDLTGQFNANNIIKEVAPIVGGRGGGRADFAKAGGKDPSKADEALERVLAIISKPTIL